ncbi:isopeptide-forming domain-containing fimbrial protein [Microcella daejeonensis]|uniref:Isopeptide-forming domain-containing fimbrial protein n=1 Tax=Microcella daejeonensis TaxID=2994971 RepID=A0A9E8MMQ3_9MICO|nr:SdrD B-like domain-containing protein [Microcella daejeonensis]WAB82259.1 isopeptide-forming domain-containing fimbrial protein [Microcella daejeonensis]
MPDSLRRALSALTALAVVAASLLVPSAPALAAGSPDVSLSRTVAPSTLYGDDVSVTLEATQSTGPDGYNLSFSDVIPPGATVTSSSVPVSSSIPLADGSTRVIFSNVADLLTGARASVQYAFDYPTGTYAVGAVLSGTAEAHVNSNPRVLPRFDSATGAVVPSTSTGFDDASSSTTLVPFRIEKSEPSAEAELLRGVQDHITVYSLTIVNNSVDASSGFQIVDHLPAGLEFLGCAPVDNSAAGTEEYPGAGRIGDSGFPTLTDCVEPDEAIVVEADPDGAGPLPLGVYTRVTWPDLGALAAGASRTIQYAAGIPLRENVVTGGPDATATLDDNTGALTSDEQALENHALLRGVFRGVEYTDETTETVSAEDVLVRKSVDSGAIEQNALDGWTLTIESSEYATSTGDITVTDVIPDGLEFATSVPAADGPAVDNADGTQTVTWTLPGFTARNGVSTIQYSTSTLTNYRATGGPVSANDSWTNSVDLATIATVIVAGDGSPALFSIIDASSASQSGVGVTIDKLVAERSDALIDCGTGAGLTFVESTGGFRVGDLVCWRLGATFPGALDTLQNTITDFLPAGFVFESFDYTAANTVPEVDVVFAGAPGDASVEWDLTQVDVGERFEVVVTSRVASADAVEDGDVVGNLMKMSYRNTAGDVFQLRDEADAELVRPVLGVDKSTVSVDGVVGAPVTALQAGEVVAYSVAVANTGGATAADVSVRDLLPTGIECADVSAVSDGGVCSTGDRWIEWTIPSVAVDATEAVTYSITIPATVTAGDEFTNTAGVRSYDVVANTGVVTEYVPSSNIDPALESQANSPVADDAVTVRAASTAVVKTLLTAVTESGNTAAAQAAIGEQVTFTVTATIPQGTTLHDGPRVTDTVDGRLEIIGTPTYRVAGGPEQSAVVSGQIVTAAITPDPYVNAADSGDDTVVLTITARVREAAGVTRGTTIPNSATLAYETAAGTPRTSSGDSPTVQVVEPSITMSKTNDAAAGRVVPGQLVQYSIQVSNAATANVSTAHDLVVTDDVPTDLIPVDAAGDPAADGAVLPGGGVWSSGDRTITFAIASLAPGASTTVTYPARVADPVTSDGQIVNRATTRASSLAGVVDGERTTVSPRGGAGSGYLATSSSTVRTPSLGLTKSVDAGVRTIGEIATYTLRVSIPAGIVSYDATIVDTLPTGVAFREFVSDDCAQASAACAPAVDAERITFTGAGSASTVGFSLGDIAAAPAERIVTIVYTGVVTDAVSAGATPTNSARYFVNTTNELSAPPSTVPQPADFDSVGTPATASVTVVEPRLVIDKDVVGQSADLDTRRAAPGDVLEYTLTVRNTGTSPAYDLVVTDAPDARLTGYAVVGTPSFVPVDVDPSDGTLRWSIPGPLAVGASASITYRLTVPADLDETDEVVGAEVVNTADVIAYAGVPAGSQTDGITYRTYDDVTPDVVSVELDLASIGDRVWFDVDGDGADDAGEPGIPGVGVTITFAGVDGAFGTADDEVRTTTTAADGSYLVETLPGGLFRVAVDGSTLPAGMTPSYDLDGGAATPNGSWQGTLAEGAAKRDVDFGYAGTGSIGDLVWFDRDRDGSVDAGEPGVPGVTVTLVWAGFDGDLATTADNLTSVTTTDAAGAYLVEGLPAGEYSVAVSTLPAGASVSSDPLGGTSATVTTSLGAAEQERGQDFGVVGDASLGDLVWLDRNGDGVRDADEPGIVGATLEIIGLGADGVLGGGDDAVFGVTTDADGLYSLDGLLPGDYVVTVTGGLPLAAVNSYDLDGDLDDAAGVTLGAGDERLDLDFGYDAASILGDLVWWDLDGDGAVDEGEPGLPGVGIRVLFFGADGLEGTADDLVFTTTTDADGAWAVVDVPEGSYRVSVDSGVPAGFASTYDLDGSGELADGSAEFTLDGGRLDVDFGYRGDSSIGDRVWLDLDGDGVQGDGEPGIPGASVELLWFGPDGVEGSADDVVLVTTTDGAGVYSFIGLPAGEYRVTVDESTAVAELEPTADRDGAADRTTVVSLPGATAVDDADFGFIGTGAIGSTVWLDLDGDGLRDEGEPGIPTVVVTVTWAGLDGILGNEDDAVFTTTTDADGAYLLDRLPAGSFTVALEGVPAGVVSTADPDGEGDDRSAVVLGDGEQRLDQDFGYRGDSAVGDLVWLDVDGDGVRTGNEPGIADLAVEVRHAGADGLLDTADDLVVVVRTGADGGYRVGGLPAGEVRVSYGPDALARGLVPASDLDGGPAFSTLVTLEAGEIRDDVDFVVVGSAMLDGIVFDDADGDGVRDPGELGLPGVRLDVVWQGPAGAVTISVTTDSQGRWSLEGLPAGRYTATVDRSTVAEEYRETVATGGSIDLPAFGSASVVDGFTTLALPVTGATASLAVIILLGLSLLCGGAVLVRRRRETGLQDGAVATV